MPESATTLAPETSPAAPTDGISLAPAQRKLLDILRNIGGPLFAILDAARDDRILQILAASGEEYQSLYTGLQGEILAPYAPYLVRLPADSTLLETLIAQGWGQSWGIYLVSAADWKALRKHFRAFLIVKSPENRPLYFRYYDPRVLRVYFPTCNVAGAQIMFGPVDAYLCENETSTTMLMFKPALDQLHEENYKFLTTSTIPISKQ